jgi:hypothetical protein
MSANEFKQQVEKVYGSEIADKLWQSAISSDYWPFVKDDVEATVALIQLTVTKQILAVKAQRREAESRRRKRKSQLYVDNEMEYYVVSVSEAAKDDSIRDLFRDR